eukprot:PITA_24811
MLKKGSEIKWTEAARRSFETIKRAIMEAPTLVSPDYNKELYIFSFASSDTLATVLLQKNGENVEHPVAFFSKTLRDAELRVTTKKSIRNSPFKLVYGTEAIFPIQLTLPVAKFLQEELDEGDDMARGMSDLVEVQKIREQLIEKLAMHQKKIKEVFDKKVKMDNFQVGDWVLKWDAFKEKKGNHGKFDALWSGPFVITQAHTKNTFFLHNLYGESVFDGPINGHFLKLYFV